VGPAGQSLTRDLQVGLARQGKTRKRKKVARANGPEVFQRPTKGRPRLSGRLGCQLHRPARLRLRGKAGLAWWLRSKRGRLGFGFSFRAGSGSWLRGPTRRVGLRGRRRPTSPPPLLFLSSFPLCSTLSSTSVSSRGGQGRRASVVASKRLRSSARRGRGGEVVLHPVVRSRFAIGLHGVWMLRFSAGSCQGLCVWRSGEA